MFADAQSPTLTPTNFLQSTKPYIPLNCSLLCSILEICLPVLSPLLIGTYYSFLSSLQCLVCTVQTRADDVMAPVFSCESSLVENEKVAQRQHFSGNCLLYRNRSSSGNRVANRWNKSNVFNRKRRIVFVHVHAVLRIRFPQLT